ncbi:hypothetical protein MAAFP003_2489 [Mycobacterium ahvazicum]|uniref:Uncharacterized protein n=1 Tax=Mycobacterium ahvazicum TaxID=1964395 RepID=A0A2K4YAL1_9MYCO|nr:hypothetical protein [Mycobacterium ahvazicum]SOX53813.1 hypothetical protein MAAFP003_2489 [Mycobacterium ahvazicum]
MVASVWLLVRPAGGKAADCATARAMWSYYESQLASARTAAQEPDANNSKTEVAYRNMINELQSYAGRISSPGLRSEADAMVAINRDLFEQWKRWVAESQSVSPTSVGPTPSDRQFGTDFTQNAEKLKDVHAELQRRCAS